ncbi:hypothetical protein, partial [Paraburkholderia nodosa]|uniref:hypothetical protein n=1 Tax=Paraburkholderia nodosa TaxID=392320 RepID=UPI000552F538
MADLPTMPERRAYHRDVIHKLPAVSSRFLTLSNIALARSTLTLRSAALAIGAVIALSACGHALPDDPFASEGQAMA